MKKIFLTSAVAFGVLALTGCSDFLDQSSASELDTENTYNSEYYTGAFINKIYGGLTQDRTYSQDMAFIYNMNSDVELVDGLGANATLISERGFCNYNTTPAYAKLADLWTAMYGVIENCNLAIDGIRHSSIADRQSMKFALGEAITIRAMLYFDLVRLFGDIPMKMEPTKDDLSNVYLPKVDRDEILDALLADLDEAVELLPWAGQNYYTTERATKGYAHALAAQIALTKAGFVIREKAKDGYETADYTDAVYPTQRPSATDRNALYKTALNHLTAIMNSNVHKLNPSFEDEWYKINQLAIDATYRENLFEIPMLQNVSGELGYTVGVRMNGVTSDFGYGNSSGKMKLTSDLFYSYDPNDIRRDITCSTIQIKEDVDATGKAATITESLGNAPFGLYVGKWDPRMENDSWLAQNKAASAKHMTGINVVKIRYAQVLLWYAEIMNELAGPDGNVAGDAGMTARQALALVHQRGFDEKHQNIAQGYIDQIPANKEDFFKAIVDENKWELAGEGARKWDLIRWNLLTEKILEMKQNYINDVTAVQEGENEEYTRYQKTVYYNYTNASKTYIDESSFTWYGFPDGKTESDYAGSKSSFGSTKLTDANIETNLPSISSGLTGTALSPGEVPDVPVKNRYLMPIPATTISASNGTLYNSYGW
jgi:hypothetical protein